MVQCVCTHVVRMLLKGEEIMMGFPLSVGLVGHKWHLTILFQAFFPTAALVPAQALGPCPVACPTSEYHAPRGSQLYTALSFPPLCFPSPWYLESSFPRVHLDGLLGRGHLPEAPLLLHPSFVPSLLDLSWDCFFLPH